MTPDSDAKSSKKPKRARRRKNTSHTKAEDSDERDANDLLKDVQLASASDASSIKTPKHDNAADVKYFATDVVKGSGGHKTRQCYLCMYVLLHVSPRLRSGANRTSLSLTRKG